MVAGPQQTKNGVDGRHPGAEYVCGSASFQFRQSLFHSFPVRVVCPSVIVSLALRSLLEHIRRSLINRSHNRPGVWIRLLSYVDCIGSKPHPVPPRERASLIAKPSWLNELSRVPPAIE